VDSIIRLFDHSIIRSFIDSIIRSFVRCFSILSQIVSRLEQNQQSINQINQSKQIQQQIQIQIQQQQQQLLNHHHTNKQ